jgi:hypothetical protein
VNVNLVPVDPEPGETVPSDSVIECELPAQLAAAVSPGARAARLSPTTTTANAERARGEMLIRASMAFELTPNVPVRFSMSTNRSSYRGVT